MPERIGIIGGGMMGKNHARTLAQHADLGDLAFVVDPNHDAAEELVNMYGNRNTEIFASHSEIDSGYADGVIIVSPSRFHAEQAIDLMDKGIGVLVEKPLAMQLEDVQAMDFVSKANQVPLMVGHIEVFNPTVRDLKARLGGEAIKAMHFSRLGNTTHRSRLYHDVVQDLMIHDIAIANYLLNTHGADASIVSAFGRRETPSVPDPAEAILDYDNNISAHLRASRSYSGGKKRQVEVETESALFVADLINRKISVTSADEPNEEKEGVYRQTMNLNEYRQEGTQQPLYYEHKHFIDSLNHKSTPAEAFAGSDDAYGVLRIVHEILAKVVYNRKRD